MGKDESVIPKGPYCYTYKDDEYYCCPYWSIDKTKPIQANGYCSYMEKGDWNLNEGAVLTDLKTGEETPVEDLPFGVGLLWDQCKECGVNDEFDSPY